MIAILDTHVLVWMFERPTRLSSAQQRVIRKAGPGAALGVADISLWEIAALFERGRVRLALPLDEWLARATAAPLVERLPITPAIAREIADLPSTRDWDPADRIIVATARVHGVPLVTSDERISESRLVRTVS